MKKILSLLLVSVMVMAMLVGCGAKEDKPAEEASESEATGETSKTSESSDIVIGATIYKYDDNFMSFVRRAIETGMEGKGELIINDSQNDQSKQNEQVEMMISKGVNALAINLVDPQAATTIIGKAKAEDVPVVFFNKEPSADDMSSYDKCWYVGTTSAESGIIQGELIATAWQAHPEWDKNGDGKMQYVMLKGEPGHPDAEARTKYSIDTVVEKGIEVQELEIQTAMWDTVKAKELVDAWLSKHGEEIEFVVCNNDGMALGAISSLQAAGYFTGDKFMPVVGVDAIPDALDQIEKGTLVGTVLNDAKNQGLATVQLSLNVAQGKDPIEGTEFTLDETKAVRVPYVAINKDNIQVAKDCYGE